jgi:hypothetical protein
VVSTCMQGGQQLGEAHVRHHAAREAKHEAEGVGRRLLVGDERGEHGPKRLGHACGEKAPW